MAAAGTQRSLLVGAGADVTLAAVTIRSLPLLCSVLALLLAAGCTKRTASTAAKPQHSYRAPHQGTIVMLGREEFHLEIVRDSSAGTLTAYLFDGTMSIPVRSKSSGFELVATVGTEQRPLTFLPQPDPGRSEAVGDTSRFAAQADWLKTTARFDAQLTSIKLLNSTFLRVAFPFPAGNEQH